MFLADSNLDTIFPLCVCVCVCVCVCMEGVPTLSVCKPETQCSAAFSNRAQACDQGGFPGVSSGKESAYQCRRRRFSPWVGKNPGVGHGNPLQYSCLENPHRQRSLVGYSPWGCKQLNMTETT